MLLYNSAKNIMCQNKKMINKKQTDKLSAKVAGLEHVYQKFLVNQRHSLNVSFAKLQDGEQAEATLGQQGNLQVLAQSGMQWGSDFTYGVFSATLNIPKSLTPPYYLEVNTGAVESLIFIDDLPVGMCDVVDGADEPMFRTHQYIPFSGGKQLKVEGYAGHTYYGTAPHHGKKTFPLSSYAPQRQYQSICVVNFNQSVKRFIDNLALFNSYFRAFSDNDIQKTQMYQIYETLFAILSPDYAQDEACNQASQIIENYINGFTKGNGQKIGAIGHSHLDTVWLWDIAETRRKLIRTVSTAVQNLKRYPQYKFFLSTVLYLEWIKDDYPDLFEQIKQLVKEGRFEPNGSTYVECDCVLTSGESLVRQFLYGKQFLKQHLNYDADTFWLPDTFGYSASLPQIMQKSGVKNFLTTKLSWNDTNTFPYESFIWQGIDGSKVKAHFNTIHCPLTPETVASRINKLPNKHYVDSAFISYGYGDGGGGPSSDMVNTAIKTENTCPFAQVKHTTVSQFMSQLNESRLPVYRGELYLELHRGTLTMHQPLKQLNRKLEMALHNLEVVCALNNVTNLKEQITQLYKIMLINQFHDILPGTSIAQVNQRVIAQQQQTLQRVYQLTESVANSSSKNARPFNTLSFAITQTVEVDGSDYVNLSGKAVALKLMSAQAQSYFTPVAITNAKPFSATGNTITTPFGTIVFNDGAITSYIVKGREIASQTLNQLTAGEDIPNLWDNWDIDADYVLKQQKIEFVSSSVVLNSPCAYIIRSHFKVGKFSTLVQDTVIDAFSPRITFNTKLDWQDQHIALNTTFNTNLVATTVKSETQFGYVERQAFSNTSVEQAQFIKSNFRWSDLSETTFGLTLLNDCKHGFFCEGGTFGLNLFKSGMRPDNIGDKGIRYFSYALVPHQGGFSAENTVQPAYAFNFKPILMDANTQPLLNISAPNVICESIKQGEEGGTIIRLYQCDCSTTTTQITFNTIKTVCQTNLLETPITAPTTTKMLTLTFAPFEIKTLKIN